MLVRSLRNNVFILEEICTIGGGVEMEVENEVVFNERYYCCGYIIGVYIDWTKFLGCFFIVSFILGGDCVNDKGR